ncbi:MAG: hypothetical protein ABR532_02570 [Candidatus Dormibacteria bacterium]
MSSPALPPRDIDFVPRGPVAKALDALRHSVILLVVVVVASNVIPGFFITRLYQKLETTTNKVAQVQSAGVTLTANYNTLQAAYAALEAQRAQDAKDSAARSIAGQQALAAVLSQISGLKVDPATRQQILDAIHGAVAQSQQTVRQGTTPPGPAPTPMSTPGAKTSATSSNKCLLTANVGSTLHLDGTACPP